MMAEVDPIPAPILGAVPLAAGFQVRLDEFAGPFEVLLQMISKRALEVTELALHQVTDEFCAYIRDQGTEWSLDEASAFIVVAATLLDLKAARLLPSGEVDDEEDLALLEARDLLFARLLQYRAFKEVSIVFARMLDSGAGVVARTAGLDPRFQALLPEVEFPGGPSRFARLAAAVFAPPKPEPTVSLGHLHSPLYSVSDQIPVLESRLRRAEVLTFRALVADANEVGIVVARFLALLDMFRRGYIGMEQVAALGDLQVRWIGAGDASVEDPAFGSEFDSPAVPAPG